VKLFSKVEMPLRMPLLNPVIRQNSLTSEGLSIWQESVGNKVGGNDTLRGY